MPQQANVDSAEGKNKSEPKSRKIRLLLTLSLVGSITGLWFHLNGREGEPNRAITQPSSVTMAAIAADQDTGKVGGTWKGTWTSSSGYIYLAEMHLKVAPDDTLEGDIHWTLKKTPRETEQSKLGLNGIEYIKGNFDSKSRSLFLEGYKKDDPNTIIGLDKYSLHFDKNNKVIEGITWNHGSWQGTFSLLRE